MLDEIDNRWPHATGWALEAEETGKTEQPVGGGPDCTGRGGSLTGAAGIWATRNDG